MTFLYQWKRIIMFIMAYGGTAPLAWGNPSAPEDPEKESSSKTCSSSLETRQEKTLALAGETQVQTIPASGRLKLLQNKLLALSKGWRPWIQKNWSPRRRNYSLLGGLTLIGLGLLGYFSWSQKNSFKALVEKADKGDSEAQFKLAVYYEENSGIENKALSRSYYEMAANQDHTDALVNLGHWYEMEGTLKNHGGYLQKAEDYYRKAAQESHPIGLFNFGILKARQKKLIQAFSYFEAAADLDHPGAQNYMGYFYYTGEGGRIKNYEQALHYFQLAANQNHPLAQYNLGLMHEKGQGGLSPNWKEALPYFTLAANQGVDEATQKLIHYAQAH